MRKYYEITAQDEEDFEQEKLIQKWIERARPGIGFNYKNINSKGNARHSGVIASFSLDQKVTADSTGTFADLIAGSDGRDLCSREDPTAAEMIDAYLACLGFNEEDSEWLVKILRLSESLSELPSATSPIDLEW